MHHIDGDGTNNNVENLMYVTGSENTRFACGTKVRQLSIGGKPIAEYDSIEEAREKSGASGISQAINGGSKTSGGFRWEKI